MLIFLAGLQNISPSVEEAAIVDGAGPVQRFFRITIPLMRPTIFFVVTLGLIGTWQVFDQIYAGSGGDPRKTTLDPRLSHLRAGLHELEGGAGRRHSGDPLRHHHVFHGGQPQGDPRHGRLLMTTTAKFTSSKRALQSSTMSRESGPEGRRQEGRRIRGC